MYIWCLICINIATLSCVLCTCMNCIYVHGIVWELFRLALMRHRVVLEITVPNIIIGKININNYRYLKKKPCTHLNRFSVHLPDIIRYLVGIKEFNPLNQYLDCILLHVIRPCYIQHVSVFEFHIFFLLWGRWDSIFFYWRLVKL